MKHRVITAMASGAALLLFVAGCSAPADDGEKTLVVAGPATALSLDPYGDQAMEDATLVVGAHIYDTLVRYVDGEVEPSLATSWTNPDETTWLFELRDDVTFHDGSAFTASAVEQAVEAVRAGEGPLAPLWAPVDTVTALSDTELEITTFAPFGGIPVNLSMLPIAAPGGGEDGVGTGPFTVSDFAPGERLVLAANEDYWGGAPELAGIEFRNIPEQSSRVTALINDEIDLTWGLSPDQFSNLESTDGIEFLTESSYQHYYGWFNAQRAPFDDQRVRQAMIMAVDWDGIMSSLFPGVAQRAEAPIPSSVFGFAPNEVYPYDPDAARDLLAEAGVPDGFATSMQYNITCCSQIEELAQAIASDLAEVGVQVEVLPKETGAWVEDLLALNWDINLANNVTVTGDANFTIGRLYTCAANRTGTCDADLDALITAAQGTLDEQERAALWGEAGAYIWEQAIGVFPFDIDQNYAYRSEVTGFTPGGSGNPVFTGVTLGG